MSIVNRFAWFLAPGILQGAVAFLTIPAATLRLGPVDYGTFALLIGFTSVGTSLAMLGSSYRLAEVFSRGDLREQCVVVSAQMLMSTGVLTLGMLVVTMLWWFGGPYWPEIAAIPATGVALGVATMLGTGWWLVASDVLTVTRGAKLFAFAMVTQSLVNAATLVLALFVFDLGALSLYVATFAASVAALFGAVVALRPYLTTNISMEQWRKVSGRAGLLAVSNTAEAGYQALERTLLSSWASLTQLGLYVHANQYKALVGLAIKAGARSIWRDSLDEARTGDGKFIKTVAVWSVCYLAMAIGGLMLAAVGKELIGWITHGKFDAAAPYAAACVAVLLTQHLGKPQTAILYAFGHGNTYARLTVIALVIATIVAVLLIPLLGVWGALLAGLAQNISLRLQVHWFATRQGKAPRQDRLPWWGLGLLAMQLGFNSTTTGEALAARLGIMALLIALLLWIARREMDALWQMLRAGRDLRGQQP